MGDGIKDWLTVQMRAAVERHACYCEENLHNGWLKIHAICSAECTQYFWQTLASYIEDELIMLLSFDLEEKQVLLLLLNQIVQICDNLFKFQCKAMITMILLKVLPHVT